MTAHPRTRRRSRRRCRSRIALLSPRPPCSAPPDAGPAATGAAGGALDVVAAESFLADIAQNVAGDRFTVRTLIPPGADPHSFEPTPKDLGEVAAADLVIVNGGGLEGPLLDTLDGAGGSATIVDASAGLQSRVAAARRTAARRRSDRPALLARPGAGEDLRGQHPRRVRQGGPGRGGGLRSQRRRLHGEARGDSTPGSGRRSHRSRPRIASSS